MGPRLLALSVSGMMAFAPPALAADTIRVMIDKLKFAPAEVSAHVGDTIEWVSGDFVAHTAISAQQRLGRRYPARRGPVASRCSMPATSTISVAFIRI